MIEPGDVVTALLPGVSETKRRPAVVVSTPAYHAERPDVLLALITSRVEDADSSFDCVLFDWSDSGLKIPFGNACFFVFQAREPDPQNRSPIGCRLARSSNAPEESSGFIKSLFV